MSFCFLGTHRSGQHDNRAFEYDRSNANTPPANEILSTHSSHRTLHSPEIEAGRTKLHRLLDEVLDKADSEEIYNPDSDAERQKRRRQRRRLPSTSDEPKILPINNNNQPQIPHIPVIPQVSERPDPSLLRLRYNPYEAGDRAHDISRLKPVELIPKYDIKDPNSHQYTSRSNPPLFYDDSNIADRSATATDTFANQKRIAKTRLETDHEAIMRHNGGHIDQRQHKFHNDGVSIDSISKNRGQTRIAWDEPDINNDLSKRTDYRDEYIMAKRSVLNTKNIISSIHDELQHIVLPTSGDYHA
ncbi:unnamed protein product [Adineta steineri]|uniref:Uncharacterized protein n=1 Tax=Adineta steineri TaxID=433720 RepID=A0A814TLS5_9BILA|nr:unnamed protein product [Adineta steineri]